MTYCFEDYCVCPNCALLQLFRVENSLQCHNCQSVYEIRNGIPILLPNYSDELYQSYLRSYERLASDDLLEPIEQVKEREYRHKALIDFMGDLKGKKVLDIGSSHALYLAQIEADFKVAFDIAFAYLETVPSSNGIVRICGDAEHLPFLYNFFDVIIISDVLEHLLNPKNLLNKLELICNEDTQIFIHIPWEEVLESYINSPYEFTHQRSFNAYNFGELWHNFYIERMKKHDPDLNRPFIFNLEGKIPLFIYNWLVYKYFFEPNVAEKDFQWRRAKIEVLPKNEWWLLWCFKAKFKMFEMKRRTLRNKETYKSNG